MNISKAKEQIRNAITAYLTKDDLGNYVIPVEKQRPVLLIGPPGIGKTAVMEQLASELGIGLISYSMTHHTRQSAIGLPFISRKVYGGEECDVTEYTMSEIIASVYDLMETTGVRQGILFLDEINCVSETLSPLMMQFLQYKVFGGHRLPEGWIVVTAGNPSEYNDSAREFDIVTLDRLKKIEVEPDFEAWKEYASAVHMHPAIMSFLHNKRDHFYHVETTVSGKSIVTPRGWEDLSKMLLLYEANGIAADEDLVVQYLQNAKTAKEFTVYLDLFNKYKEEYPVDSILEGEVPEGMEERASGAGFDEVYTLTGLLLSSVKEDVRERMEERRLLESVKLCVREYKAAAGGELSPADNIKRLIDRIESGREAGLKAHSLTREESDRMLRTVSCLYDMADLAAEASDYEASFEAIRGAYAKLVAAHNEKAEHTRSRMDNMFRFAEKCWGEDKEMLMAATELTADPDSVSFISIYGCDEYFRHNKGLLLDERDIEIKKQIEELGL
ncbi:MAG: AAA family ATPase [Mogibacterium sp.]|nr:AAA family ATPase [Mogibacterium sp.]